MEDENIENTKTKAKDLLKCGLCFQTFNSPRRLPCAHSFCCSCLQGYCGSLQTNSTFRLGSFNCPTCQMLIGLPKGGVVEFPVDARIGDIRESAVTEMKEILRKKFLAKRRNSLVGSLDFGCSDSESQMSDVSSQEAKSSVFEDDQFLPMNKKRPFERYQSFASFDAHHRNSETGDQSVGRPRLNRLPSKSSSLREVHRRKAQDLMAAFDKHLEFASSDSFISSSETSRDHNIHQAGKSEKDLFRKSTSRYKTHRGDNIHEESSATGVSSSFNRYGAAASEGDYEMSGSFSSSTGSKFLRTYRGYQSLRETGSRRRYQPSVESIFHEFEDQHNVDCGNDVQPETQWSSSESINTTLHQRKKFDSNTLEAVSEKIMVDNSSSIYDSSDFSVSDSHTVITESMPFPCNLSKYKKIPSSIQRKSSGQNKHTTVFESILTPAEEEYVQNRVRHSENGGHYMDSSKHCHHFTNTFSPEKNCAPKVVISEPFDEKIDDSMSSTDKQCADTRIFCEVPCAVNKIAYSDEEKSTLDELHEREVLQEFDFLMNDDEGIGLDSERSDSVASINTGCIESNCPEQHLGFPCTGPDVSTIEDYRQHSEKATLDAKLPDKDTQNSFSNEDCMTGKYSETSESLGSGTKCEMDEEDVARVSFSSRKASFSDPFVQCSSESSSHFDNFTGETDCSYRSSFDKCGTLDDFYNCSAVVDSGKAHLNKKDTKEGTAHLHHVSSEEYLMPTGVVILSQGNTVVADYGVGCLQYYADDGSPLHKIEGIKPFSIAVNPSNNQVIVGDRRKKTICVFDDCGCDVAEWDANMFKWICGIGVLRNGDLVVLDREKSQFGIYKPDGQLVYAFGSYGNTEKQLCMGEFLVVDGMDRIVTCDSGNHCVKIFSVTGSLLQTFGDRGEGDGELQWPKGICTDDKNNIIIADTRNSRVSMFSSNGSFVQHLVTNLTLPYAVSYSNPNIAVTMYSVMGQSRFHLYSLYDS